jgi:hypothetical protein
MSKSNIDNYIIGFCAYYLMVYAVVFYPAIVMMQQFGSLDDWADYGDPSGIIAGILAGGSTVAIILFLCFCFRETGDFRYLLVLIIIYIFFLHPFIQYLDWIFNPEYIGGNNNMSDSYLDTAPFPGFDWIPFLF